MDNSSKSQSEISSSVFNSFLDKLKPSSKNKIISQKIAQFQTPSEVSRSSSSVIDDWGITPIPKTADNLIQISQNLGENSTKDLDFSNLYENMNYVNNIIKENYQQTLTEYSFLKTDTHLVFPFLLITSKEIHRMTLSDYEIKLEHKKYKLKCKNHKLNSTDYYKRGIIYFYQGKYIQGYLHFKQSYAMKNDSNVLKWLVFSIFILIFCVKNEYNAKIDYYNMGKVELSEEDGDDGNNKDSDFIFFNCCTVRKKKIGLGHNSSIATDTISKDSINRNVLCKDLLNLLPLLLKNNNSISENNVNALNLNAKNENEVTAYWIYMLLGIYIFHFNKDNKSISKIFNPKQVYDPKLCVKKIKEIDDYLGYVAYAQMNAIIVLSEDNANNSTESIKNKGINIKNLLFQVIKKDARRIEAYLLLWEILTKTSFLDYKQAYVLSKKFYDNISSFSFENRNFVDYLYVVLTHAKSQYYLGNFTMAITFYQKELCCNFLYPSLYYLMGKYGAKSKSKNLKNISISILTEASRLLFEDLQTSSVYWIGYVNYCSGNYEVAYENWKVVMQNPKKCFDFNKKKYEKINNYFFRKFSNFGNTYLQLKNDIRVYYTDKKCNSSLKNIPQKKNKNDLDIYMSNNNVNNEDEILEKCNTNLNIILTTFPKSKDNKNVSLLNSYYKGEILFYLENKHFNALSLLMKVVANITEITTMTSQMYYKSLYLLWKILNNIKEYGLGYKVAYMTLLKIKLYSNCCQYEDLYSTYINLAKSLFKLKKVNDGMEVIKYLHNYSPIYPIEEMKFLPQINKSTNISVTNDAINTDFIVQYFNIDTLYYNTIEIFKKNYTKKEYEYEVKIENNVFDSTDKIEVYLDNEIEKMSQMIEENASEKNKKNEFISVISDPFALYLFGKYAAKTQIKIEEGIKSLSDYLKILKFQNNYTLKEQNLMKKYKGKLYLGILYILTRQYDRAKECFDRIQVNFFHDQEKLNEFIMAFNLFYNKNIPNSNFDYNHYSNLLN